MKTIKRLALVATPAALLLMALAGRYGLPG